LRKTFNALTGTPLARLHMPEKHLENARLMAAGQGVEGPCTTRFPAAETLPAVRVAVLHEPNAAAVWTRPHARHASLFDGRFHHLPLADGEGFFDRLDLVGGKGRHGGHHPFQFPWRHTKAPFLFFGRSYTYNAQ
jgi:hypothetical protein